MKALIVVPLPSSEWDFLGPDHTPSLIPFYDRPFLQHIVEMLASSGVRQIAIAPMVAAAAIRRLVGEGKRWGIEIDVHPISSETQVPTLLAAMGEPALVCHGERLPDLSGVALDSAFRITREGSEIGWSFGTEGEARESSAILSVETPQEYMATWRRLLQSNFPGLVQTGREVGEKQVVARGARIHPSATIVGPVYIGERCLIGAGAHVGPNAYVLADSIVEDGAKVQHSVVMPYTYVGPRIELIQKFAYRSTVYDVERDLAVTAIEEFLLGSTANMNAGPGPKERLFAAAMAVPLLPFAALGALARLLVRSEPGDVGLRSVPMDFLCRFAPGVWAVAVGKRSLVGVPKLSSEARKSIDELAPGLTDGIPEGIVSEAYLRFGPKPSDDEMWAAVAMAAASRDSQSRRGTLGEYLKCAFGLARPAWRNREA